MRFEVDPQARLRIDAQQAAIGEYYTAALATTGLNHLHLGERQHPNGYDGRSCYSSSKQPRPRSAMDWAWWHRDRRWARRLVIRRVLEWHD